MAETFAARFAAVRAAQGPLVFGLDPSADLLEAWGLGDNPDGLDRFADIVADGHRAREVIQGIRNMARKSEVSHSLVGMNEVIEDLLRIVRADAMARKVSLVAEIDANAGVVMGDRVQLLQVLLNLTMNAFEALSVMRADARRVNIWTDRVKDGQICVSVRDSGPGFPPG